ncbi:TniQ family protein [Cereibacter sphaeroides]|uniref:TniQ family protein n=1 Tax=Cereibacter sphaeroides TaxID=1063 RepID=UPI001F318031|nr:TniQ family protein [Cereibacter sphaeroides]MCE6950292.1 TniQ family protein [Cereibacter sphaeroides]
MTLSLVKDLPLLAGESLMSWVARIARIEMGMEPAEFMSFLALGRRDIIDSTPCGLARMEALTGEPTDEFLRGTYTRIDDRLYEHRSQRFHAEFAGRDRTTFCPACLLADREEAGSSKGQRVGRVNWLFAPVRTCPVHGVPLVRFGNRAWSERFQDMKVVAPADEELQALVARTSTRRVSPLQIYVERRLEGQEGPARLDGQQIDLAVRATEILGMCVLRHPHVELPAQTEADWDEAGAVGYGFTSRGEEGIREALDEIRAQPCITRKQGGPQAIFGRLYQWLQYNRSAKDRGPIREVVREYFLDTMEIAPGTMLFGEAVPSRRRHSVASLARQFGLNYRTLNRALVLTGLVPAGDADVLDRLLTVDAAEGERLAARMRRSISVAAMPSYLNCCRLQAEALVRHGVIARIGEDRSNEQFGLNMVAIDDLDDFLQRFRSAGREVSRAATGMADVVEVSRMLR